MGTFRYKAVTETGRITKGRIEAANLLDLEARIKHMGFDLIEARPTSNSSFFNSAVKSRELIDFCFHMWQLLKAGVPLIESVEDFANSLPQGRMREIMGSAIPSIRGGKSLSQALEEYPQVFNEVFISLLRSGEQSGNLPQIFEKLLISLRWQDELRSQMIKVLMYPVFALVLVLGVFLFFMLYLVPKLATVLKNLANELPIQTEIMLGISEFLQERWSLLLIFVLILAVLFFSLRFATGTIRYRIDSIKLKIPLVGDIINKIILSRVLSVLSMLYASGISVVDALNICAPSADNAVIKLGIENARLDILQGKTITEAFTQAGIFSSLVIRMIRVGEVSGNIDDALSNVGYFFNRDIQESVDRLQEAIPPLLTVLVGFMIGFLALSVLGPMYDVISKVKF